VRSIKLGSSYLTFKRLSCDYFYFLLGQDIRDYCDLCRVVRLSYQLQLRKFINPSHGSLLIIAIYDDLISNESAFTARVNLHKLIILIVDPYPDLLSELFPRDQVVYACPSERDDAERRSKRVFNCFAEVSGKMSANLNGYEA
jgi:hypothetical protein